VCRSELAWVEKSAVPGLPLWEGDRIFLRLRRRKRRFSLLSWFTAAARWYRHL
jgi:hypothetical protein